MTLRTALCLPSVIAVLLLSSVALAEETESPDTVRELPLPVLVQQCSPTVVLVQTQTRSGQSQGSGVIVDASGKVLTCHHVIRDAQSVLVKTWTGGYFPAEGLLGLNPSADIALLKLSAQGLPAATMGDDSALLPGERVFSISAPGGFEHTVSEGIISALRKVSAIPEKYRSSLLQLGFRPEQTLIQFSAPVWHGSSGAPIFNSRGQVVGLVALIARADNVYFAIPASVAVPHLPSEMLMAFEGGASIPGTIGMADPALGELPEYIGCLDPVSTSCEETVPRTGEPVLRLKESLFVDVESVKVQFAGTDSLLSRTRLMPKSGEFRAVEGGFIYFADSERGKRVEIDYEYRVQRVAVLQCVNMTDYPELDDFARQCLADQLRARGFQIVPFVEVDATVRAASINVSATAFGKPDSLQPESIRQIASDTNSAVVVYSAVALDKRFGYMAEVHNSGMFMLAFDGHSGKDIFTKAHTEAKNVSLGGRRSARESCIRRAAERILEEFLGPASE